MRQAKSLRLYLVGIWLVVTGLVLVVSAAITALARSEAEANDATG